ncbi:hypothetical protein K439DRAFT_1624450 [Ramaria rubella]|nr:hypothetical protein K439DRAFT_1624450 [Ramaria rubella]
MPTWSRIEGVSQGEAFTRPLGILESSLYFDTVCCGISDTLEQLTFEIPASESKLLSRDNVSRAWVAIKNLHPLLGASVHERSGLSGVDFVVDSARLNVIGEDEILYITLPSDEEASMLVEKILNGPRRLTNKQLHELWIISFPRTPSDPSTVCHQLFLHMAHYIHDGMAQNAIIRAFFDLLAHRSTPNMYNPKGSLQGRLALHLPIDDLHPALRYPKPRHRWRLAIAQVIHSNKMNALRGGHNLPHTLSPGAYTSPVTSQTCRVYFTKELTKRVLASCRHANVTLGQALPVLAQLAHTRILYRLHNQGLISELEWGHRITQPMHFSGPFNLRPFLDSEWLATGGANRVCAAISFYRNTLPRMPLAQQLDYGQMYPTFDALLSKARFLHRCQVAKQQTMNYFSHPLLTEFAHIMGRELLEKAKIHAQNWRVQSGDQKGATTAGADEKDIQPIPIHDYVESNMCSTVGDMGNMIPAHYPLNQNEETRLRVTSIRHYLRCRPAEFYLTSITYNQELQLLLFCDTGTYEEALVKEWLSNLKQAIEWYLGAALPEVESHIHMARL